MCLYLELSKQGDFEGQTLSNPFYTGPVTSNPFDSLEVSEKKKGLVKVDSFASYTEPGPINQQQPELEAGTPITTTKDEFMAILERNSAILQQASEKNQEFAKNISQSEENNTEGGQGNEFIDIVDDADKDITDSVENDEKDKSKIFFSSEEAKHRVREASLVQSQGQQYSVVS